MNNKFEALKTEGDSGEESNGETQGAEATSKAAEPEVVPGPGEHPLQFKYTLWFSQRQHGKHATPSSYDQNLKKVDTFASVEQFWRLFSHLVRPGDLRGHSDYHLFKYGVRPMWEDEANKNGGKWIVRLRKGLSSRCWENLILALLGEQFMVGEEICGAVISLRYQEDILSLWNKTANDVATTTRIRDTLRRVLSLPTNTIMEYKTHNDSLKSLSSPHRPTSEPHRTNSEQFRSSSSDPHRSPHGEHHRSFHGDHHRSSHGGDPHRSSHNEPYRSSYTSYSRQRSFYDDIGRVSSRPTVLQKSKNF